MYPVRSLFHRGKPPEDACNSFKGPSAGMETLSTSDAEKLFQECCDPGIVVKDNLCLHRYSNESWPVALQPVPIDVPEPILGIDAQCDDMPRQDWLEGAIHSDFWPLYPSFYLGTCFLCNKGFRMKFNLIKDLPKILNLVTGDPLRIRDSSANSEVNGSASKASDPKKVSWVPPEQKEADAKNIDKGKIKSSPLYDMDPCQLRRYAHGRLLKYVFQDMKAQLAGILKVNSEKKNFGYSDLIWQVPVPAGLSPLLPSAAVGINFACDGMSKKNWKELFNLRNDLPKICEKVNEAHCKSPLEEGEEEHESDVEQGGGDKQEAGQGGGDEHEAGQGGGEEQEPGQGGEEENEDVGDEDDEDDNATEHQVLEALDCVWAVRIDIKSEKNEDPFHEFVAAVCIDKEGYLIAMPLFPINCSLMFNQEKHRFYASMDSFNSEIEVNPISVDEKSRILLLKLPDSSTPYMNANFALQNYHAYQKMHTVILKLNPMPNVDFEVNYLTHWIPRILRDLTMSSGETFSDMDEELPILQIGGVMDTVGKNLIWEEYQNNMKGGEKRKGDESEEASPKRRKFY